MLKNPFRAFDILGNVVIIKFPEGVKVSDKRKFANKILEENKAIKTVLEKKEKIKGRLRKLSTGFIAGEKSKEVLYRENDCVFRFNTDKTYFSPRLSNERKEIASKIKKGDIVLVMFAGVAPYSIVIAKNSKAKKVFSNEMNREANKYAELNIKLNKVKDKVELIPGDIKRLCKDSRFPSEAIKEIASQYRKGRLSEGNRRCPRFDVIVMPRPQLKDTFLKEAFSLSRKGTRIYYYDFCKTDEIDSIKEKIEEEAEKSNKKIKILNVKKAGELAPYKIRLRVDLQVL